MTKAFSPLVSVLLPVFNGAKYIEEAIRSILSQTYQELELCILDDGSTDSTLTIVRQHALMDSRIRIFTRENRGLVMSLNELIDSAKGELLARMDADDIADPERLARQVLHIQSDLEMVCVGTSYTLMDEEGYKICPIQQPLQHTEILENLLTGQSAICHPSALFRKSALIKVGGYRQDFFPAEDLDLWLRLSEVGTLSNLSDQLLSYRIHSSSISSVHSDGTQRSAGFRACQQAWDRRGLSKGTYALEEIWRPSKSTGKVTAFRSWGWRALAAGNHATAFKYGLLTINQEPLSMNSWILALKSAVAMTIDKVAMIRGAQI